MQRETKTLATTSGKALIVKTYLTGREMNELKRDMYAAVKIDLGAGVENAVKDLPATFMIDREAKLLEVSVISFDGSAESIVARLQDLPNVEYQEALKQIGDIIQPDFQTSK